MSQYVRGGDGTAFGRAGQRSHAELDQILPIALSKQGAMIVMDQLEAWAIEGRQFHAQQGDAATLVDLVETAYDEDQPQFALVVPSGTIAIPTSISMNFQDQAGTNTHVIVSQTTNAIGTGTSTSLTVSPMRRDAPFGAKCTANGLYTANATAATGLIEIMRIIDPFVATAAGRLPGFRWDRSQSSVKPVIVGPATFQIHAVSTSDGPEGFAEYTWIELDTHKLVSL
jgi:hypothetical protein